jgi:hypothetical protein
MDAQRVPNLEEMDEQETWRFLTELFSDLSAKGSTNCATRTT